MPSINCDLWSWSSTGTVPSVEKPIGDYPHVVEKTNGERTLVVQDYTFGKYLGFLQVTFDATGKVVSYGGNPIILNSTVNEGNKPDTMIALYMYVMWLLQINLGKLFSLNHIACILNSNDLNFHFCAKLAWNIFGFQLLVYYFFQKSIYFSLLCALSDPTVKQVVDSMFVEIENSTKEVLGRTLVKMEGSRSVCRIRECNMGII